MDCSAPQDFTGRQFHLHHHPHHYQLHPVPHHLPHHHHHHFYVSPHCPLHNYMLHFNNQHSPTCPLSASSHPPSHNPEATLSSLPPLITLNLQVSAPKESGFNPPGVVHKENEVHKQLYEEEEEEEDPVFVLTDEWREFFAKSEAKRKLDFETNLYGRCAAKKQARQKGKNRMENDRQPGNHQ